MELKLFQNATASVGSSLMVLTSPKGAGERRSWNVVVEIVS
jgi:hypothetical protein